MAAEIDYLGSPEHKTYSNPVNDEPPHARPLSDGARCDEYPKERWPEFTRLLRLAIESGCVSGVDGGRWPRKVWGFLDDRMFEARRRTEPPGTHYKGYLLDEDQRPRDPGNRLEALRARLARGRDV